MELYKLPEQKLHWEILQPIERTFVGLSEHMRGRWGSCVPTFFCRQTALKYVHIKELFAKVCITIRFAPFLWRLLFEITSPNQVYKHSAGPDCVSLQRRSRLLLELRWMTIHSWTCNAMCHFCLLFFLSLFMARNLSASKQTSFVLRLLKIDFRELTYLHK